MTSPTKSSDDRRSSRYWLWSMLFHGIVIGLILWLVPVREIVFEDDEPKSEVIQSGDKLKEIIETVRNSEEERLRDRVYLLGLGVDRIRVNYLNRAARHEGFEDAQRAAAFERILTAMDAALEELHRKREIHAENVSRSYDPDDLATLQRIDARARSHEEEAVAALPLLPELEGRAELIALQEEALDTHSRASDFTRWTGDAESRVLREVGRREAAQASIAELESRIREQTTALAAATAAKEAAETRLAAAQQALRDAGADDDREALRQARDQADAARDAARRQERDLTRDLDRDQRQLANAREQLAQAEERLPEARAGREKKDGELTWWADRAYETQSAAKDRLLELYSAESVQAALDERGSEEADTTEDVEGDVGFALITQPDRPSAPMNELADQDIPDLYETSERLIAQAITDFRAFKAIDLARMRDIAIEAALDRIVPIDLVRIEIDTRILRADITDPELIDTHKEEVVKVKTSVEDKIALVEMLLEEMEQLQNQVHVSGVTPELEDQTLEEMLQEEIFDEEMTVEEMDYEQQREAASEHLRVMEEVAREEEDQQYKDMTRLMRQEPEEEEGEEQQEMRERVMAEIENGARPPPALSPDTPGIFGRTLSEDGEAAEWMYVDTWYTIGPFPNEHRRNLNTQFPPETVVDLDARYPGKGGRSIGWHFIQSRSPSVVPYDAEEYAIYYAYTEIYSDRPRDIWIAVGSDDKANVWINDMPVWISDDRLKGWNINEGYRKVHLRQGRNRVLYRVENGHLGVAFSLSIHARREGE